LFFILAAWKNLGARKTKIAAPVGFSRWLCAGRRVAVAATCWSDTFHQGHHRNPDGYSMAEQRKQPSNCVTCQHCGEEFRAITFFHLRNIHGYDGDHPINDYKRKFRWGSAFCRDSRKKIMRRRYPRGLCHRLSRTVGDHVLVHAESD
jgi:hypothetical protein